MIVRTFAVGAALVLGASTAAAQGAAACPAGTGPTDPARITQDACQVAVDLFQVMAPQLGLAITGGNATLGQGGTLGGIGHFTIGLRGNVFNGTIPQVQDVTLQTNGRQARSGASAIPTDGRIIGLPAVDASIGLFKGIPLGVTNVGGVDLLVSAAYIPDIETDAVDVTTDSPLKLGFGARVGLLQESLIIPGVSFTWLRRDLPTVTVRGTTDDGDEIEVRDLSMQTTAWRVVASKSFLMFGVAAGVGQDRYDASTSIRATVQSFTSSAIPMEQELTRTNMFADFSFNLPFFKFVAEVGQVSGGEVTTYNAFTGKAADASRVYGSLGLRFGF